MGDNELSAVKVIKLLLKSVVCRFGILMELNMIVTVDLYPPSGNTGGN